MKAEQSGLLKCLQRKFFKIARSGLGVEQIAKKYIVTKINAGASRAAQAKLLLNDPGEFVLQVSDGRINVRLSENYRTLVWDPERKRFRPVDAMTNTIAVAIARLKSHYPNDQIKEIE